jgi:hypothetical protein
VQQFPEQCEDVVLNLLEIEARFGELIFQRQKRHSFETAVDMEGLLHHQRELHGIEGGEGID